MGDDSTGEVRLQTAAIDVFLALRQAVTGLVLFGLRAAQLYAGGQYNLVSGKVEAGEDAVSAVLREAWEEAGVRLAPDDLQALGAVHTVGSPGQPRVGMVFTALHDPARHGAVINAEPGKCDGLRWADPAEPPWPLESYNEAALRLVTGSAAGLVMHGWPASVPPP